MTYQTDFSSMGREEMAQGRPGPPVVRQGAQERADRPLPGCRSCPRARQIQKTCIKGTVTSVFLRSQVIYPMKSALHLGLKISIFLFCYLVDENLPEKMTAENSNLMMQTTSRLCSTKTVNCRLYICSCSLKSSGLSQRKF
jgi:hypothetical protein